MSHGAKTKWDLQQEEADIELGKMGPLVAFIPVRFGQAVKLHLAIENSTSNGLALHAETLACQKAYPSAA